ncbi:MAG: hypothetical protein WDW38_010517 [Sanguina aurantia]
MLQFGKILSFPKKKGKEGEVCRVVWYYKPEDLKSGRKSFHGKKELLASDHEDPVPEGSIIGHAKVHTLLEYEALKTVGKYDFFSRFTYHMATGAFVPDQVPVLCESPSSPSPPPLVTASHLVVRSPSPVLR